LKRQGEFTHTRIDASGAASREAPHFQSSDVIFSAKQSPCTPSFEEHQVQPASPDVAIAAQAEAL
jgi:hypothetical protein